MLCDEPGVFVPHVIALLRNDKRNIPQIHRETGIPFYWLREFRLGRIPNPSANRVEIIYMYITGKAIGL